MKLQLTPVEGTSTLRMKGDLDLYSVELAREALLVHFTDQPALQLDVSEVENCDAAGVQLLLATARTAVARGKIFTLSAPSATLEACSQLLGLSPSDWPLTAA